MVNIFLSYRREDTAGYTGRLHDHFVQRWGQERIFWDIDNIEPGEDFVEVIDRTLAQCAVMVVVIGVRWSEVQDSEGRRRIDDSSDFHRVEIERALQRGIRVIPALVGGARMPASMDLPEPLKLLARRNAVELTDKRFRYDVERLADAIDRALVNAASSPADAERDANRRANRSGQSLAPSHRSGPSKPNRTKNRKTNIHGREQISVEGDALPQVQFALTEPVDAQTCATGQNNEAESTGQNTPLEETSQVSDHLLTRLPKEYEGRGKFLLPLLILLSILLPSILFSCFGK